MSTCSQTAHIFLFWHAHSRFTPRQQSIQSNSFSNRSLNPQILTCGRNVSSHLLLRFECSIHRKLPDVLFIVRVLADHTSLRDCLGTRFGNRPEIVHELVLYHVSANVFDRDILDEALGNLVRSSRRTGRRAPCASTQHSFPPSESRQR